MGVGKRMDPTDQGVPAPAAAVVVPVAEPKAEAKAEPKVEPKAEQKPRPASFVPQPSKYTFDDLILPDATRREISHALAVRDKSELVFKQWGLSRTHKHSQKVGINLYGPPGTGKTMVAHAIAAYLGKSLLLINYADIESKYVGDTPKNLTEAFRAAQETDSILFFDEADAILSRRVTNMNSATDTSVNQTRSVMLTLLNEYQGVILFATNYISNFDPAFMRRILAHIQMRLPDLAGRTQLFEKLTPPEMPHTARMPELAALSDGLSGSDISNAILLAAFRGAQSDEPIVHHQYFVDAIQGIRESQQANRGGTNVRVESREVSEDYVMQQLGQTGGLNG